VHVVRRSETLASIAERYYGRIQYEKLLVAANDLDAHGGSPIVPGMLLVVPALGHYRVKAGQTWAELATELLGAPNRDVVLSAANGTTPWQPPSDGEQIVVPFNLRVIASSSDTIVTIAYRYLGDEKKAWTLSQYNGLKTGRLQRGDVVLVPLTDLPLTPAGKQAAASSAGATCSQASGAARAAQRKVLAELPALIADVRGGRYMDAVTQANRFLAEGALTKPELAVIERQLLESYAALGAIGLATEACNAWRKHDPHARVDPVMLSPKIVAACRRGNP
jgi:LysM domain